MTDKKIGVFIVTLLSLAICMLSLSLISANLEVSKEVVSSMAIPELHKPAIFALSIKNLGDTDNFVIYSLAGITIEPNESMAIASGETKNLIIKVYPTIPIKISPDYYSFEYKIKGEKTGIQVENLALTMVSLKDAFGLVIDDINPDSKTAVVHFENKYGGAFDKVNLELSSVFFSATEEFALAAGEAKQFEINIDQDKIKELLAGPYIVNAKIKTEGAEAAKSAIINFNEKAGIAVSELSEGIILHRYEIEKKNNGNTNGEVSIIISKNLFSSLFTSFNIVPDRKELSGFYINYIFKKELSPNESLKVIVKTNWWILVAVIIAIIIIWYLIDEYLRNKLVLKKRISLVKTKGGELALKVSITARARDFVEKIRIIDRLPPMVKVFERYGMAIPEKIDERNRRLEWNIQALGVGEERILSYIIYSRIGVVGKFELPVAEAIYEYKGRLREAQSNRVIFVNEPKTRSE